MKFEEIAAVSGKGGLFRIAKPGRSGIILESLDSQKKKVVVGADSQVSVLSEISIYTNTEEGATPLADVMRKIHAEFDGDTGLNKNSASDELQSFMEHILPDFDQSRVYTSDIKKLVTWYNVLAKDYPEVFAEEEATSEEKEK
ncbi:MAG: hypothetical protein COW03_09850 [Cytophagales bacterium CG12_big_fil_rev_8_21_14_0_65_40_12]|nr:MAG: hypothetical protein COW03_09850 [Cytophagales bacterium CG12_big_fil_rev_8_21_14_0_65_40_12]PIW04632.1 MAG: hypothetical protein COW40_08975 [Cytophagales bacterium CG17_big_fil_post_rev_8_21_14_2_50_40_13]